MKLLINILVLLSLITSAHAQKVSVETVILAKRIYMPWQAKLDYPCVVINNGKIVEVTEFAEADKKYSIGKTIYSGAYIYPGFIDAHCHFSGYALDMYKCDLTGTKSFSEILDIVARYEDQNELEWIYGRGWDQNDWDTREFPNKEELDKIYPHKPVILKRVDGHAMLCNQKALDIAGITETTKITGGTVELKEGRLTGILIDRAMEPVENIIPPLPERKTVDFLKKMQQQCFRKGLTGVVDCGVEKDVVEILRKSYADSSLIIGNTIMLSQNENTISNYLFEGPIIEGQLQIPGIKIYADGALGSRGACLLEEYSDMPGHRGTFLSDTNKIKSLLGTALKYNWQVCTHAIGDSTNRTILKLYSSILKKENDRRWRIEHAQVVNKNDYHYFQQYSIIPSVQPTHAISDMPWVATRLGARMNDAYCYKNLLEQNGWLPLGTDFPVEDIDPLATFYTACIRKDKNGQPTDGFMKEQALNRKEALYGMTLWAAKSVRLENTKGSLEPGKDADIVILDKDILTTPEEDIYRTKVLFTIVKGQTVYNNYKR